MGADVHTVCDIDPVEPVNMSFLLAFELTHSAPQSFWLNEAAFKNIWSMLVTPETSHLERSPLKDVLESMLNMNAMLVTLDTPHLERSPLNDAAARNILDMSFALDKSHSEIFPLNKVL